ncbi:MAG: TIGR03809 family protein [Xanthobacteraceae bacterium]
MTERPAFSRLGEIAEKWRDLAEARRNYFEQLYSSGRWKLYYTDDELLARMRDVVAIVERWEQIAPRTKRPEPVEVPQTQSRNAA